MDPVELSSDVFLVNEMAPGVGMSILLELFAMSFMVKYALSSQQSSRSEIMDVFFYTWMIACFFWIEISCLASSATSCVPTSTSR